MALTRQPFLMTAGASPTLVGEANRLLAAGRSREALALVAKAVDEGNPDGFFLSGLWRLIGAPCPRDLPAARQWLGRAMEYGHIGAGRILVALTANGTGGPADWEASIQLLTNLAKRDVESAQQLKILDDAAKQITIVRRIANEPTIIYIPDFASDEECAALRDSVTDIIAPTLVIDPKTGRQVAHPIRKSDGAVIGPTRENLIIQNVARRIAQASGTDRLSGEPIHILRYRSGQEYRPHFDALNGATNQRLWTAILYLNEGFTGGETHFPRIGAKIPAKKGALLLFSNCLADGRIDENTLHAGLPVISGEKWIATRWIRQRRHDPWNPS